MLLLIRLLQWFFPHAISFNSVGSDLDLLMASPHLQNKAEYFKNLAPGSSYSLIPLLDSQYISTKPSSPICTHHSAFPQNRYIHIVNLHWKILLPSSLLWNNKCLPNHTKLTLQDPAQTPCPPINLLLFLLAKNKITSFDLFSLFICISHWFLPLYLVDDKLLEDVNYVLLIPAAQCLSYVRHQLNVHEINLDSK